MNLTLDETTLRYAFVGTSFSWNWDTSYVPHLVVEGKQVEFAKAGSIVHQDFSTGLGHGIKSVFRDFKEYPDLAFETLVWEEAASGDIILEWIPLSEENVSVQEVVWPGPMEFTSDSKDWYTLLNIEQGLLIPNTWEVELGKPLFDGQMCTAGSYMPWYGQVRPDSSYILICEQPWDAKYSAVHPAGAPFTHVGMRLLPSQGKMAYRRTFRYSFTEQGDYNTLCKIYREYVKERGLFCSLEEKATRVPSVEHLIGAKFVHQGIKTQVQPDSRFFDPENPEKNNSLVPFSERTREMKLFAQSGYKDLYLHLDGWADPGYDNKHPDYYPACIEAGGWEGMKELSDTMRESGYLFGIHDQYRDYYFAAESFDENYACRNVDGSIPEHANWAGGHQSYLCTTQAPGYVKRNFSRLKEHDIHLDGAYLDVFTCNEPDECVNPEHRMSRKESLEFRKQCFDYLLSQGILTSSEEVTDWSMNSLIFCHYAPYEFMMSKPGTPRKGIGVPLFNLVYHDCLIIPWMMEHFPEQEDYMLYALLNAGAPYFIREGAYPDTDGAFGDAQVAKWKESYERCEIVSDLHRRVAKCEMVSHCFLDGDALRQQTRFSDGTVVTVDFHNQSFEIKKGSEQ